MVLESNICSTKLENRIILAMITSKSMNVLKTSNRVTLNAPWLLHSLFYSAGSAEGTQCVNRAHNGYQKKFGCLMIR